MIRRSIQTAAIGAAVSYLTDPQHGAKRREDLRNAVAGVFFRALGVAYAIGPYIEKLRGQRSEVTREPDIQVASNGEASELWPVVKI